MSRSYLPLSKAWPIAACVSAMLLAACAGRPALKPCGGQTIVGGSVGQQKLISHVLGPCIVIAYGDTIGTDTTFALDSIATDTTSESSPAPCVGRLVIGGEVIRQRNAETGPCVARFFMDSVGTDTTTGTLRVRYHLDSIGTDTTAGGT